MITDPEKACEAMLNQKLIGIHIENEVVLLTFDNGTMEFDGDSLEMYIEVETVN
jgi:hypothetical protein